MGPKSLLAAARMRFIHSLDRSLMRTLIFTLEVDEAVDIEDRIIKLHSHLEYILLILLYFFHPRLASVD